MQRKRRSPFVTMGVTGAAALLVGSLAGACGGPSKDSGFDTGGDGSSNGEGGGFGIKGGEGGPCTGIACNVAECGSAPDTTISGTVFAPNGTLPLYNVIVYVPNSPLSPFTDGVSCDTCGLVSGNPITSTVSNPDGTFKLTGVPVGTNVPLVFQVGKWRRQVTISNVAKCTDNPITDPNMERLPKNHTEGDMPHIAVTTGDCDHIACVLPKMGIDASEFGVQADYNTKRVIEYDGDHLDGESGLPGVTPATGLWGVQTELAKYDLVVLSCECDEQYDDKPSPDQQTMLNYLNAGGRSFGGDFEYTWIHKGVHAGAVDVPDPLAKIMDYGHFYGNPSGGEEDPDGDGPYNIDQTFPKGTALATWLTTVGASATSGKIMLSSVFHAADRIDPTLAQRWIYGSVADKVFSYTTPFDQPEANRCGKSYFLDVHVGDAAGESVDSTYPASCGKTALSAQEKMMVFFMMDLASCIQDDSKPVNPPR